LPIGAQVSSKSREVRGEREKEYGEEHTNGRCRGLQAWREDTTITITTTRGLRT